MHVCEGVVDIVQKAADGGDPMTRVLTCKQGRLEARQLPVAMKHAYMQPLHVHTHHHTFMCTYKHTHMYIHTCTVVRTYIHTNMYVCLQYMLHVPDTTA